MLRFQKLSVLIVLCFVLIIGCGTQNDTCGPGDVKHNGECVPADSIDSSDPSDLSDSSDLSDPSDPTESSDAADPSDSSSSTDASSQVDPADTSNCDDTILIETTQVLADSTPRMTLKLDCWDASARTIIAASYQGDDSNGEWVALTDLRLEDVDPDKPWADYKLVGTVAADGTKRIIFFTEPEATSGTLELLTFNDDFSELIFATGILTWGTDDQDGCVETILVETPSIDDLTMVDIALRLDCWDATAGAPEGGAYTTAANEYVWQEFESVSMDSVDANMEWATYKLVGAMADGTKTVVFFTEPTVSSGQLQVLRFTADFSEVLLDTGARTWSPDADPTDMSEASDPGDPIDSADSTEETDDSDASDNSDVSDATDPSGCGSPIELTTSSSDNPGVGEVELRLVCWDAASGTPTGGAYVDRSVSATWHEFSTLSMEAVDADNTWAAYKLVASTVDGTYRIVFFTDPTAPYGQLQIIGFSSDFSEVLFDTGYLFWGASTDDTDPSDGTDPSDLTDVSDPTEPQPCSEVLEIQTPSASDASASDVGLKLRCWDAETGTPNGGAYTDASVGFEWQEFATISMEPVDEGNEWAAYKLVATMSDGSYTILFFTDPSAAAGQLQAIGFSSDFSEVLFDTGYRFWNDANDGSDASDASDSSDPSACSDVIERQTPSVTDPSRQDVALRLECWDSETGSPVSGAFTREADGFVWQTFSSISMEAVDAGNDWASYKLVGTMADGSYRIVFFTDPTASSGQLQILGFSSDFSELLFDTGYRFW